MKTKNSDFIGTWNIYDMETWEKDYFNEESQAFITINKDKTGEFHFGYTHAEIDARIVDYPNEKRLEFSFDGSSEMDPCQGRGWIKLKEDNHEIVEGELFFHMGDSSRFLARRKR